MEKQALPLRDKQVVGGAHKGLADGNLHPACRAAGGKAPPPAHGPPALSTGPAGRDDGEEREAQG